MYTNFTCLKIFPLHNFQNWDCPCILAHTFGIGLLLLMQSRSDYLRTLVSTVVRKEGCRCTELLLTRLLWTWPGGRSAWIDRDYQEHSGTVRNIQEHSGTFRNSQELSGTLRTVRYSQEQTSKVRNSQSEDDLTLCGLGVTSKLVFSMNSSRAAAY